MFVWALPISMPITQLRSIAPSHRCHLIDVTDMDMKAIQQLLSNLLKLGNGLGLLFECFTQPPRMLTVSIKTDLWQLEKCIKATLLGLSFVEEVDEVKWFCLKSWGNLTTCYTAKIAPSERKLVEILEGGGMRSKQYNISQDLSPEREKLEFTKFN